MDDPVQGLVGVVGVQGGQAEVAGERWPERGGPESVGPQGASAFLLLFARLLAQFWKYRYIKAKFSIKGRP